MILTQSQIVPEQWNWVEVKSTMVYYISFGESPNFCCTDKSIGSYCPKSWYFT